MTGLIDLVNNFGLAAIVLVWTVQGVLDIRSQGLRRKPVLKCAGAVAIYVAVVGAWYFMHVITTDLVTRMDSFPAVSITGGWGREFPPDKRTEYTQILASSVFVNSGRIIQFIDQDGTLKPYAPNEADINQRDSWLKIRHEFMAEARAFSSLALAWLAVLPLGLVVVLFWPGWKTDAAALRTLPRK